MKFEQLCDTNLTHNHRQICPSQTSKLYHIPLGRTKSEINLPRRNKLNWTEYNVRLAPIPLSSPSPSRYTFLGKCLFIFPSFFFPFYLFLFIFLYLIFLLVHFSRGPRGHDPFSKSGLKPGFFQKAKSFCTEVLRYCSIAAFGSSVICARPPAFLRLGWIFPPIYSAVSLVECGIFFRSSGKVQNAASTNQVDTIFQLAKAEICQYDSVRPDTTFETIRAERGTNRERWQNMFEGGYKNLFDTHTFCDLHNDATASCYCTFLCSRSPFKYTHINRR